MPSPPGGERSGEAWVDAAIGPLKAGERVLALCRGRATATLVRRWATRRGGVPGLEVASPGALAAQLGRGGDVDGEHLPPDSDLGRRIGDRPGLTRLAHRWVRELRVRRALGEPSQAPPAFEALLAGPFGRDAEDESLVRLVEVARARGRQLNASLWWDRVVTFGFDDDPARGDVAALMVARALGNVGPAPTVTPRPLPWVDAPDVVAEARAAVEIAAEDPAGTLILVGTESTARRIRDALDRNGVGGALRDPVSLSAHPVASAVRRAAEWFAPGAPSILGTDLFFVLSRTSVGGRLHPAAASHLAAALPDDPDRARFSTRDLAKTLERTHLRDAPLDRWLAQAAALRERGDAEERRAAVHLWIRLTIVDACARGVPFAGALGDDDDDFADAVRELLGDLPGPVVPLPNTVGALSRLLVELRVRVHSDPVARAILGALRDRATLPMSASVLHDALSGPGLDPQRLPDGVDVVQLTEWDGRPCRTLVVADVHDHGAFRPQAPDPFLSEAALARLGAPTAREVRDLALRTVYAAADRAERVRLIVTRTDASGRDTVPPVDLALEPAPTRRVRAYGAELDLPERRARTRIAAEVDPQRPFPPAPAERALLVRAANLEWALDGRQVHPPLAEVDGPHTLAAALRSTLPSLPDDLRPWLGFAEGIPEAALPERHRERAHSVSRLLQPLSRCAWQAFALVVLGVRKPAELTDALDPREVGKAAHAALQRATGALRVQSRADGGPIGPEEDAAAAVAAEDSLHRAVDAVFDGVVDDFGVLSPSRIESVAGLRDRWKRHLTAWVRARRRWPRMTTWYLTDHPSAYTAEAAMRRLVPAAADLDGRTLRRWLVGHWDSNPRQDPAELLRIDDRLRLPESVLPDLPAVLDDADVAALGRTLRALRRHQELVQGHHPYTESYVAAEVPFGHKDTAPAVVHGLEGAEPLALPEARLKLGAADLALQGTIDRVDFVRSGKSAGFVVTDYKTSKVPLTGEEFRRHQWALEDPQLLVYAMVVARAAREEVLPPALRMEAAAFAHDRVRHTFRDPKVVERIPDAPDTWMPLDPTWMREAARELGELVDGARGGRWPLRPHRHRCPRLGRGAFCDLAAGCRLRGLPDDSP